MNEHAPRWGWVVMLVYDILLFAVPVVAITFLVKWVMSRRAS
jgi:hypothetical protein